MKILVFLLILFCCINTACNIKHKSIPLPEKASEFPQPVTTPLKFTKPVKINWQLPAAGLSRVPKETKTDLEKIPSFPINTGAFIPMQSSMKETKINWKNLPDTAFDFDRLPSQKLRYTITSLSEPTISKIIAPHINLNAKTNLLIFDKGLPDTSVIALLHARNGQMWVGTANGICRFDGETMSTYGKQQGLGSLDVNKIAEDKEGNIWIGTRMSGIIILDIKAGIIKKLTVSEALGSNIITGLMADKAGRIWIGTWGGGVNIIDEKNASMKHFNLQQGLSDN